MTGAVLWDLDGTLVDSEECHWHAWRDAMAAEGVHITYEQFVVTFGWRNDAIIPRWLEPGAPAERVARIGEAKEALYRAMVLKSGLKPLPGADVWVRRLKQEGWPQAVASSAPRKNIDVVLEALGLADCFQAVAAAEDVKNGKPDPEVYLVAAQRLGATPDRCVVVEDAVAGVEGARRAGMRSIGISRNGKPLGADLETRSLDSLPQEAFHALLALR